MKIEVWSDFVCPFCYIGKRRLEAALEQFPHREQVEIELKSFELDPDAPKDIGMSVIEVLAKKYNISLDEAKDRTDGIAQQAEAEGLTFHFETMIRTNTFDAHRLAKYAKSQGKEIEITEKLLYAYFTESKHIGEHQTLMELATAVGLDQVEVEKVLQDTQLYADEVRTDENRAQQIGVRGVPFFMINQKYTISGAYPTDTFLQALQQAWEEK